jgi:hypothetical protein
MSSTSDPPPPPEDTGDDDDGDGDDLTASFFKAVKERGIEQVSIDDEEEEDEDEDDEDNAPVLEDDNEPRNIPQSEVNRFIGRDEGKVGKLAGNVTFTNRELYGTLKERVLESPAAFSNLVGGTDDDDDEMDNDNDDVPNVYRPPKTVPDSGLTAGEVVTTVLEALNHNDEPEENAGVRLLYEYSSPSSALRDPERALSVEEYADFLQTTEYSILLRHGPRVTVEKAEYAFDRKKSFFTVRLLPADSVDDRRQAVFVNFILSTKGSDEDDCWMIDSIIIRSDGIRRRGRR